jgi:hypothetical protein
LVFGLAFGMLLVLLVVPSIMAMQADIARQVQSAKRALQGRRWAMTLPAAAGAVTAALLFAVLVLPLLLTGAPWVPVVAALPFLAGGFAPALGLFLLVLVAVLLAIYAIASVRVAARRMRA